MKTLISRLFGCNEAGNDKHIYQIVQNGFLNKLHFPLHTHKTMAQKLLDWLMRFLVIPLTVPASSVTIKFVYDFYNLFSVRMILCNWQQYILGKIQSGYWILSQNQKQPCFDSSLRNTPKPTLPLCCYNIKWLPLNKIFQHHPEVCQRIDCRTLSQGRYTSISTISPSDNRTETASAPAPDIRANKRGVLPNLSLSFLMRLDFWHTQL